MRKEEIAVGGEYLAKVNDKVVRVRVDQILENGLRFGKRSSGQATRYHVTNLVTGRATTFRSAAKFRKKVVRSPAKEEQQPRTRDWDTRSIEGMEATAKSMEDDCCNARIRGEWLEVKWVAEHGLGSFMYRWGKNLVSREEAVAVLATR